MFHGAKPGSEHVEFRVRKVTRYIVTEYHSYDNEDGGGGGGSFGSGGLGEFENARQAFTVAKALCEARHRELGWPEGDPRIVYPTDELVTEEAEEFERQRAEWLASRPRNN